MLKRAILLVDDHEDSRSVMCTILEHHGYRVLEAGTGEEGVALAMSENPDLILMDMRLPGLDGVQASRAIRGSPGLERVPIVAVTADVSGSRKEEHVAGLFHSYVSKPVRPRELVEHIRSVLGES